MDNVCLVFSQINLPWLIYRRKSGLQFSTSQYQQNLQHHIILQHRHDQSLEASAKFRYDQNTLSFKEVNMALIVKKKTTSFWGLLQEIFGFIVLVTGGMMTMGGGGFAAIAIVLIGIAIMTVGFLKSFKTVCSEC